MLYPPLRLPKFTFLCGKPDSGQNELAAKLCSLDDSLGMSDFAEPLRTATTQLFFDCSYRPELDLTKPENYNRSLPFTADPLCSNLDFMSELHRLLENRFTPGILGEIALKQWEEDGGELNVFDRFIFRDATNAADVRVFVNKFGSRNCLAIHCGELSQAIGFDEGVKHIWLLKPDLESRIEELERELK